MSEKSGSWWDFYGVRYAQGAVVGAMLVFMLFSQNSTLKKLLFIPEDPADFGAPHLILLAVYGLAYCYIASAPILIMHAARGLQFASAINLTPSAGWRRRVLAILGPTLASTGVYATLVSTNLERCIAVALFASLVSFQFLLIFEILKVSWDCTIKYYEKIIEKRAILGNAEFVESYKHIREHGNSFLIVLFQFFLAYPVFMLVVLEGRPERVISSLITLVVIWILPASFIWLFGNKLENHLQDR